MAQCATRTMLRLDSRWRSHSLACRFPDGPVCYHPLSCCAYEVKKGKIMFILRLYVIILDCVNT